MRAFLKTTVGVAALLASPAIADPSITVSPPLGHPQIVTQVSGSGFMPGEKVDLFFDSTDLRHAVADDAGNFTARKIHVPADALPGAHTVSGVGRKAGDSAQSSFNVTTKWHEFGFDAKGARSNPYENVINASNASTLDVLWTKNIGMDGWDYDDSPVYVDGTVFIGNSKGQMKAFASDGTLKWTADARAEIETAPAVVDGLVYVTSYDENLYAFDAATGVQVWKTPMAAGSATSPAVYNGVVYTTVETGDNPILYAMNATTGALLWSVTASGEYAPTSPAAANGIVYMGTQDHLFAYDASTGAELWSQHIDGDYYSTPAISGGKVFIGEGSQIDAFDAAAGTKLWTAKLKGSPAGPAIADGVVYIGTDDTNQRVGDLYALDAATGAQLWVAKLGEIIDYACPAIANGVVYIGSYDENLYAFDAATGAQLWKFQATDQVRGAPAVADGMLFDASIDGNLYDFALNGGNNAVYKRKAARPSFSKLLPAPHKKHAG